VELSTEVVIAGYAALGGAIVWLAHNQKESQRRCERDNSECRSKHAELDEFIRDELIKIVGDNASREQESVAILERSRRAIERIEKRVPPDLDETPLRVRMLGGES